MYEFQQPIMYGFLNPVKCGRMHHKRQGSMIDDLLYNSMLYDVSKNSSRCGLCEKHLLQREKNREFIFK